MTRWRFGVKVRAELDRVSGLALMPIRRLVDDVRAAAGSRGLGWDPFRRAGGLRLVRVVRVG
jgi:hypothetical protein